MSDLRTRLDAEATLSARRQCTAAELLRECAESMRFEQRRWHMGGTVVQAGEIQPHDSEPEALDALADILERG